MVKRNRHLTLFVASLLSIPLILCIIIIILLSSIQ